MIERIFVKGFKSFKNPTEVELRSLTILAGANSSGKSSLIQPLLLWKQTLLSGSDAGPLRLDGPNVHISDSRVLFFKAPGTESKSFLFGISANTKRGPIGVQSEYTRKKEPRGLPALQIAGTTWQTTEGKKFKLTPNDSHTAAELIRQEFAWAGFADEKYKAKVVRDFCFLVATVEAPDQQFVLEPVFPSAKTRIEQKLKSIIHVPGLRGNPMRSWKVRSLNRNFPGYFQDYVASLLASWRRKKQEELERLTHSLREMQLTWKVDTRQKSETELEIRIGRTPQSLKHGARDMVNIADTGFGVSQSLPVLVALEAADAEQLVYLEQPEIHLHPEAQIGLADAISRAVNRGVQVVLETHSHLLLLAFQKAIAENRLAADKAILHWVERDAKACSSVRTTSFHANGTFADPKIPLDFADISMRLMEEFLSASFSS